MAKNFIFRFGTGDPAGYAGLSPTFTVFKVTPGGATPTGASAPPGITQLPTSTGLYYFTYTPLTSVAFVIDGGNTLNASERYVVNAIDAIQTVDTQVSELGTTLVALGNTGVAYGGSLSAVVGTTESSFGSTLADPSTVMGFLRRAQEFLEGNSTFIKATGIWNVYSRGSSTQLRQKTLTDVSGTVSKT